MPFTCLPATSPEHPCYVKPSLLCPTVGAPANKLVRSLILSYLLILSLWFPLPPEVPPSPVKTSPETTPTTSPRQRRDSDRYCQLCNAWFNNPGMAQQHYDGKKHKKNAARADLLEQLGKTLDMGEMKGRDQG